MDAAAAKSDFETAEKFFQQIFLPYQITSAPRNKAQADEMVGKLNMLADRAQESYSALGKYGESIWTIAVRVRLGEVNHFKAIKIATIPAPAQVVSLNARYPSRKILNQYEEAIQALVVPLEARARAQWRAAAYQARTLCIHNGWVRRAQMRLEELGESHDDATYAADFKCPAVDATTTYLAVTKAQFDEAEAFYERTFAHYEIKLVPRTTREANEFVTEIDVLATGASQRLRGLAAYRTGPWSVAALALSGEVSDHQASTILDIPAPKDIFDLDLAFSDNKLLIEYEAAMAATAAIPKERARKDWAEAVREGKRQCIDDEWTSLAKQRLAQP